MNRQRVLVVPLRFAFILALSLTGCDGASTEPRRSGRFLFQIRGYGHAGQFIAETSDAQVLQEVRQQLALPADRRHLHINGAIARTNSGQNLNWHWQFVPSEWRLAEISAEVCDGSPEMVEADLAYWIDRVGRFCPWQSFVFSEL